MNTTIQPPPRYEILTAEFLRQHGAVQGLKATYQNGPWEDYADHDVENPNHKFSAPLGTTAMYSTPLPEARCECHETLGFDAGDFAHTESCPVHPRNALVRVLPEWLAGCPTKPEGLVWAMPENGIWQPYICLWTTDNRSTLAYAVPAHVHAAEEARTKMNPDQSQPAPQEAGENIVTAPDGTRLRIMTDDELPDTDEGLWWANRDKGDWTLCTRPSVNPREYSKGSRRWLDDFRYAIPIEPGQEVATDAAQSTDTEILDWLEKMADPESSLDVIFRKASHNGHFLILNNAKNCETAGEGKTLRVALINAMNSQPK